MAARTPPRKSASRGKTTAKATTSTRALLPSRSRRAQPESLPEHVYAQREEHIVTLRLEPGRTVSELALSEMTGIGRTPIREAIQRLAREHLIVIMPQRGLLIPEIDVKKQLKLLRTR